MPAASAAPAIMAAGPLPAKMLSSLPRTSASLARPKTAAAPAATAVSNTIMAVAASQPKNADPSLSPP